MSANGKSALVPVLAVPALVVLLTLSSALAQNDARGDDRGHTVLSDNVIVTAPRAVLFRGEHGGEIRNVARTGKVRFDDLDLSTPWGRTELKARVQIMASNLCGQLERLYPVEEKGNPSCYDQAVDQAMRQTDLVIADSRYDYWRK